MKRLRYVHRWDMLDISLSLYPLPSPHKHTLQSDWSAVLYQYPIGKCDIVSRDHCDFVEDYFHEEPTLCSQVRHFLHPPLTPPHKQSDGSVMLYQNRRQVGDSQQRPLWLEKRYFHEEATLCSQVRHFPFLFWSVCLTTVIVTANLGITCGVTVPTPIWNTIVQMVHIAVFAHLPWDGMCDMISCEERNRRIKKYK